MKKCLFLVATGVVVLMAACNNSNPPNANNQDLAAPTSSAPAASSDPEGLALIKQSDCGTCHTANTKIIGPAYKDIAAKYPNTPENRQMLIGKVTAGGSGVWGNVPMTPHPALQPRDLMKMIDYILSSK